MPKVLLIDDDPHLRKILSKVLTNNDFGVVIAEDGASGLQAAKQQRPDLIILDIIMPGMDGFEVAQRLHRDPLCARIPIMVLTAYATPYGRKTAVEVGVDDFVAKPFGIDDLVAKVRAMTAGPATSPNEMTAPLKTANQARIICLHSLRGGLGCTSLAIGLASALKDLWQWPTLLLDGNYANGQLAQSLNWPDALSWSEMIQANLEDAIPRLLDDRRMANEGDLHLLTAPRDPRDADRLTAKVVRRSLRLLEQRYEYIVADMAHDLRDNTLEMLKNADKILHLLSADAVSKRLARNALATYWARGIQPEDVLLVLVDPRPGKPAVVADVELIAGHSVGAYIPYTPEMTEAINQGLPFVESFPDQVLTHLVEDLAFLLSKPAHRNAEPSVTTLTYSSVQARMATAASQNGSTQDLGSYMLKQAGLRG